MSKKSPVALVLERFGWTKATFSKTLGVVPHTINMWESRNGGRIPQEHFRKIIKEARRAKVQITTDELVGL